MYIKTQNANDDVYGLGFSLGANILTLYLAEKGPDSLIKAAMTVCNPFSFEINRS